MINNRSTFVWENTEALSYAAAYYFVMACNNAIAEKGKFTVALSGGNTPKRLYQLLASPAFSRNIDWKRVLLFWSDERFVPHTQEDSNYKMVKDNLLDHIHIPKKNIFPVPTKGWPEDCAAAYAGSIKKALGENARFDLILLGMGDDGHTASLFPLTQILQERKKLVKEVWVESKRTWRISFTFPLINRGQTIIFLVAGETKARVLKSVLSNRKLKNPYPVQGVQPKKGTAIWMLDEAATRY